MADSPSRVHLLFFFFSFVLALLPPSFPTKTGRTSQFTAAGSEALLAAAMNAFQHHAAPQNYLSLSRLAATAATAGLATMFPFPSKTTTSLSRVSVGPHVVSVAATLTQTAGAVTGEREGAATLPSAETASPVPAATVKREGAAPPTTAETASPLPAATGEREGAALPPPAETASPLPETKVTAAGAAEEKPPEGTSQSQPKKWEWKKQVIPPRASGFAALPGSMLPRTLFGVGEAGEGMRKRAKSVPSLEREVVHRPQLRGTPAEAAMKIEHRLSLPPVPSELPPMGVSETVEGEPGLTAPATAPPTKRGEAEEKAPAEKVGEAVVSPPEAEKGGPVKAVPVPVAPPLPKPPAAALKKEEKKKAEVAEEREAAPVVPVPVAPPLPKPAAAALKREEEKKAEVAEGGEAGPVAPVPVVKPPAKPPRLALRKKAEEELEEAGGEEAGPAPVPLLAAPAKPPRRALKEEERAVTVAAPRERGHVGEEEGRVQLRRPEAELVPPLPPPSPPPPLRRPEEKEELPPSPAPRLGATTRAGEEAFPRGAQRRPDKQDRQRDIGWKSEHSFP